MLRNGLSQSPMIASRSRPGASCSCGGSPFSGRSLATSRRIDAIPARASASPATSWALRAARQSSSACSTLSPGARSCGDATGSHSKLTAHLLCGGAIAISSTGTAMTGTERAASLGTWLLPSQGRLTRPGCQPHPNGNRPDARYHWQPNADRSHRSSPVLRYLVRLLRAVDTSQHAIQPSAATLTASAMSGCRLDHLQRRSMATHKSANCPSPDSCRRPTDPNAAITSRGAQIGSLCGPAPPGSAWLADGLL